MRSWFEPLRRLVNELVEGTYLDIASQLAFNFLLSLFPALMTLLALASFFRLRQWTGEVTLLLAPLVTVDILILIRNEMTRLSELKSSGILTAGAAVALWSSSSAMVSVIHSLNFTCGVKETRPWWRVRLLAAGLTMALAGLMLATVIVLSAARWLGTSAGLGSYFELAWSVAKWPASFALLCLALDLIYHFAPDTGRQWRWITPGAVLGAALWAGASFCFKFYIANFSGYAVYGAVGAAITLLLWLYVSSLALLLGSALNVEVDRIFGRPVLGQSSGSLPLAPRKVGHTSLPPQ